MFSGTSFQSFAFRLYLASNFQMPIQRQMQFFFYIINYITEH